MRPSVVVLDDQHARLRERARRPDIEERAAAAIRHPQAGILPVPTPIEVRVGGVRVVVRILAAAFDLRSAVAAQEAHVVHHRRGAGHPLRGDGARVDAAGVESDADDDVAAAFGRLDHRLGSADALEGRRPIAQHHLRGARMQADQDGIRPERDRVADDILSHREIDGAMRGDRLAQDLGIVGRAIALRAERAQVHPGVARAAGRADRISRLPAWRRADAASKTSGGRRRSAPMSGELQAVREDWRRCTSRPAPANFRPLSRNVANTGTRRQTAFSMLICVRGLSSRLTITAGPEISSKRASFTQSSSCEFGFDGDRGGHVAKLRADQRESGGALADGGLALAFEGRVHQR